jgi:hypothetical protein
LAQSPPHSLSIKRGFVQNPDNSTFRGLPGDGSLPQAVYRFTSPPHRACNDIRVGDTIYDNLGGQGRRYLCVPGRQAVDRDRLSRAIDAQSSTACGFLAGAYCGNLSFWRNLEVPLLSITQGNFTYFRIPASWISHIQSQDRKINSSSGPLTVRLLQVQVWPISLAPSTTSNVLP